MKRYRWIPLFFGLSMATSAHADQVISDNQIVQGSMCVGFDCVNDESFGFDTLRLKENNLRIKFEDTSAADEPANIWQLTVNDSTSGGEDHFSIDDITALQTPFKVRAAARNNSLYVSPTGNIGFGTSAPTLNLQILSSNTPAMRIEQDTSNSATPQTWDIAGNEANFFVRDVTGGSRLPLRIRPGAPHNSLTLATNGSIGAGTPIPSAQLHVFRSNGTAQVKVIESSGTTSDRTLFDVANLGDVVTRFEVGGSIWLQSIAANTYALATGTSATPRLRLTNTGNIAINGTLAQGSSRALKQDIFPLDLDSAFGKVLDLPVFDWRYAHNVTSGPSGDRHIGPMAEDFHERFDIGANPRALAPGDVAAVALAAVQSLSQQLDEREGRLVALLERLDELERCLDPAEKALR